MASSPLNNGGGGGGGVGGNLMNFSRIFFGHVNFSEMNEGGDTCVWQDTVE